MVQHLFWDGPRESEFQPLKGALARQFALLKGDRVFAIAMGVSLAVVGLHVAQAARALSAATAEWMRLDSEGGLAETLETLQLGVAAVVLALAAALGGRRSYAVIGLGFAYVMLDNAQGLHEQMARLLVPDTPSVGEFLYMGGMGAALSAVAVATMRLDARADERASRGPPVLERPIVLCAAAAMLGLCAVFVDAAHFLATAHVPVLDLPLTLLEDGGELIATTAIFAESIRLFRRRLAARRDLA